MKSKIYRMFDKIHSRRSINRGNPNQASPTYIKASSVMSNIHCVPVPSFPPEELCDVHQHQYSIHKHGIRNSSIFFILFYAVSHSKNCPRHHAKSAVCENFDIKVFANTRI
nr:hypothetical protein Iba_scaffold6887CG0010 [Ipomoea batatas]